MSTEKPTKPTANIIKGPWKKRKTTPIDLDIIADEVSREEANDVCMAVMQFMVRLLAENEVDISTTSFVRDSAMIYELLQGTVYRDVGLPHPTQTFMENFVLTTIHSDDIIETQVDFVSLNSLTELLKTLEPADDIS